MNCSMNILTELLNRRFSAILNIDDPVSLHFEYLKNNAKNHTIITKEKIEIPVYNDEGEHEYPYLYISDHSDPERQISLAVEEYMTWREECLRSAVSASSVSELLDVCSSIFINPIALFDESLSVISYSGTLPPSVQGTIWEDVITSGSGRPEIFSPEEYKMISENLTRGDHAMIFRSEHYPNSVQISMQVYRNGSPAGIIGATDLYTPLTKGMSELFEDISSFLSLYLSHSSSAHENETDLYPLERMLNGFTVSDSSLERMCSSLRWNVHDTYQVMTARMVTSNKMADTSYVRRLTKQYPDTVFIAFDGCIVMLRHLKKHTFDYKKFSNEYGFACGISLPFHDLKNGYYMYIQSRIALSYASEREIISFPDVYDRYILESLFKLSEPKALCHPSVLQCYESENGRTLIHNLKAYLLSGRSISETARNLNIHRNTLLYRLEKLDTIFETKLSDLTEQQSFFLLLSCMIAENTDAVKDH